MGKAPTGKSYMTTELEEHFVLVGEPGEHYLTHLSPPNSKGRVLAKEIFEFISNTDICAKLVAVVGSRLHIINDRAIKWLHPCIGRTASKNTSMGYLLAAY